MSVPLHLVIVIVTVDPRLGLFAAFTMAVTIAFVGSRPAKIRQRPVRSPS